MTYADLTKEYPAVSAEFDRVAYWPYRLAEAEKAVERIVKDDVCRRVAVGKLRELARIRREKNR